eukprot:1190834-Amorphochlora_amoeboformis.AAC.1
MSTARTWVGLDRFSRILGRYTLPVRGRCISEGSVGTASENKTKRGENEREKRKGTSQIKY